MSLKRRPSTRDDQRVFVGYDNSLNGTYVFGWFSVLNCYRLLESRGRGDD